MSDKLPGEKSETPDHSKDLESIRSLLGTTLKAMSRLKEQVTDLSKQIRAVELSNDGSIERVENLEQAIQILMTGAPDKLKEFLDKAATDGNNAAEALAGGSPDAEDETPPAEVVGS